MTIDEAIEQLSVYFTNPKYEKEVLAAKAEFFGDVGIDDKESDRYEQWMNLFFDWYLFTRPLSGMSLPPAKYALEIDEFQQLMGENREIFVNLSNAQHSLYQFIKIKGDKVYFKDLIAGKKIAVNDAHFALTLDKGAICDFRIVDENDNWFFAKGFCAHPEGANKFILKEIKVFKKESKEEQEGLLLDLIRMFFKLEQYSHLQVRQVYTRDSKVRF